MDINDYIKRKRGENAVPLTPEEAVNKYANMDESELMGELFRAARQGRESGELNDNVLDNFFSRVAPLLTPEQNERMKELIVQLKRG